MLVQSLISPWARILEKLAPSEIALAAGDRDCYANADKSLCGKSRHHIYRFKPATVYMHF